MPANAAVQHQEPKLAPGFVKAKCQKCSARYMCIMDLVEIQGDMVEFHACFQCLSGYTRYGKQVEVIT